MNPQLRPQVGKTSAEPYSVLEVLGENARLRAENTKLRRRVVILEGQRNRWHAEAKSWKWGALRWARPRSA